MSRNKKALPMRGIRTPRFFIWFRGFWQGKVLHTGGLCPETNEIASGYVTGQIKRFRNACVTRREKAEEKLNKAWVNADELLVDYAAVTAAIAEAEKEQNAHSESNAQVRSKEKAAKRRASFEEKRQAILKSLANGLRYQAIPEIMKEENAGFPYMVYTFSDDTQIAREMGPLDDEYNEIPIKNDGETTIFGTVIKVLNDYKNRVWDGGANPKIIFLTDGAATDLSKDFLWFKGNMPEFTSALEEYSELGINISTVGLGSVDREVMRKMAETTGGVFVSIQNASDLGAAMKTAATSYSDRNLLSIRYMKHLDKIYGVVRILFLSIIGMVIGSLVLLAYMEDTSIPIIIVSSAVSALAGSVLLELGLKIGIPQGGLWCCLWILFSLTLGYIYPKIENSRLLSWNEGCRMAPMAYRTLKMKRTK